MYDDTELRTISYTDWKAYTKWTTVDATTSEEMNIAQIFASFWWAVINYVVFMTALAYTVLDIYEQHYSLCSYNSILLL